MFVSKFDSVVVGMFGRGGRGISGVRQGGSVGLRFCYEFDAAVCSEV